MVCIQDACTHRQVATSRTLPVYNVSQTAVIYVIFNTSIIREHFPSLPQGMSCFYPSFFYQLTSWFFSCSSHGASAGTCCKMVWLDLMLWIQCESNVNLMRSNVIYCDTLFGIADSLAVIQACKCSAAAKFWSFAFIWSVSAQVWNLQRFYQHMQDKFSKVLTSKCLQPFPKLVLSLFLPSSVLLEVLFFLFLEKSGHWWEQRIKIYKENSCRERKKWDKNDSCSPLCVKPTNLSVWSN